MLIPSSRPHDSRADLRKTQRSDGRRIYPPLRLFDEDALRGERVKADVGVERRAEARQYWRRRMMPWPVHDTRFGQVDGRLRSSTEGGRAGHR